uniref:Uncharacterized protein n=1 Tax=Paramormyrops kingsleyae TaxID=1676925 RepID=A0A3B3SMD7_9TELE
ENPGNIIAVTGANGANGISPRALGESGNRPWVFPVAVLASAIFISVFIGLAAKGRLIYRYLASYRHTLLPEVDEMDDDGFIEDNYIQDCERERAHLSI